MNTPNKTLRFYRIIEGQKVPCIIELNEELILVREHTDTSALRHVNAGRNEPNHDGISPERQRGITMARWASESIVENPIEGTDNLRDSFFHDLRELREKHIRNKTKCKPCEQGKLIRLYRMKLEQANLL